MSLRGCMRKSRARNEIPGRLTGHFPCAGNSEVVDVRYGDTFDDCIAWSFGECVS